jgi:hygromycin-B 7''-O-kinase
VELTNAVAEAIMRKRFASCVVESVSLCQGGEISTIYEARCTEPNQCFILKFYPKAFHWKMEKEIYVYGLLERVKGLPIPSLMLWNESKQIVPLNYLVMTKIEGQPLLHVSPHLSGKEVQDLYRELATILARIHTVTFDEFGYITTGVIDPHPTNAAYMRFQFEKKLKEFSALGGERSLHCGIEAYVKMHNGVLNDCQTPVLCHDDFHEGNVLVSEELGHWRVTGIIDVENAVAGDPFLDLAKTDYYAIKGNTAKLAGFIDGYGSLPENWRDRLQIYRLYHALELWDWFASIGKTSVLSRIENDLRRFCAY